MNIYNKKSIKIIIFMIFIVFTLPINAEYSIGIGYQPKYPDNFSHFSYVNPNAKKTGSIKLSAFGTFESLNPFLPFIES